jgi:hypothetical protein
MHPRLGRKPLYSADFDDKSRLLTAMCISVVIHSVLLATFWHTPVSPSSIDFPLDSGENVVIRCGQAFVDRESWSTPFTPAHSLFPLRIS